MFTEGHFKEAETGRTALEDINQSTFGDFLDWLYFRELHELVPDEDDANEACGQNDFTEADIEASNQVRLVRLYVFADKYNTPALKLVAVSKMLSQLKDCNLPWYQTVIEAFEILHEEDPMLKLFIELYAFRFAGLEPDVEKKMKPFLPNGFLYGVMLQKARMTDKKSKPPFANKCRYHTHSDETEKKACPDYYDSYREDGDGRDKESDYMSQGEDGND